MTAFSLRARLHFGANSDLALSLPQSRCFNPFSPRQLPPQREPRALPRRAQLHICGTTLSKHVRMAHTPQLFIKAKVPLSRHFCKYISPNRSCRKEKWRWYRFSAARSIAEQPPSGFRAFGCGHRVRVCRRVRLSCFRQSGACRHHRGGA